MDRQATFDRVRAHLLTQGRKSMRPSGLDMTMAGLDGTMCAYRSPDGLKCAIGCLIPSELYTPDMERIVVGHMLRLHPELARQLDVVVHEDISFLRELQYVHDTCDVDAWDRELRRVATSWGLNCP